MVIFCPACHLLPLNQDICNSLRATTTMSKLGAGPQGRRPFLSLPTCPFSKFAINQGQWPDMRKAPRRGSSHQHQLAPSLGPHGNLVSQSVPCPPGGGHLQRTSDPEPSALDGSQPPFLVCEFLQADVCQTGLDYHWNICLSWVSQLLLLRLIFETSCDGWSC